ncbi:MAG: helix-turn-helix transcriptional regulator [Nitrospinales bacterium]
MKNRNRFNIKQTEERTGFHRQSIWRKYSKEPPEFPRPHYIGNLRFWYRDEIEQWEDENVKSAPNHNNLPLKNPVKHRPLPDAGREKVEQSVEL